MATKSGMKVIFVKSGQYTLDILGVENFDEIPVYCMVKEIEANLWFSIFGENSKWPPFLGRGKCFENWQEKIALIPCGSKISTKSLYLARLRRWKPICVFAFLVIIQNSRHFW